MRHLLKVSDLSSGEIQALLAETEKLKNQRGKHGRPLEGKTVGLFFEKPSVRTRISFEVGIHELGGGTISLGNSEWGGATRESPGDFAKVISRYLHAIIVRTFAHSFLEALARELAVPLVNGLSDLHHPCQALSDLFTVQERLGRLRGVRISYIGDGNNVCHSLMEGCALVGAHVAIATPSGYEPDQKIFEWAQRQAKRRGSTILVSRDPKKAVVGADVVYADVWTSMGQEKESRARKSRFQGFQVNEALMRQAGPQALFMHCLPAHRGEEVTDEVIDSRRSIVYDQAENRLHLQKAVLLSLFSKKGISS